ncbi:MAG: hypothetical protein H6843_02485 [Rhodospirillaceae bacterium]|nr:hypothetical protein [Rhodospirillaceae bacterium]
MRGERVVTGQADGVLRVPRRTSADAALNTLFGFDLLFRRRRAPDGPVQVRTLSRPEDRRRRFWRQELLPYGLITLGVAAALVLMLAVRSLWQGQVLARLAINLMLAGCAVVAGLVLVAARLRGLRRLYRQYMAEEGKRPLVFDLGVDGLVVRNGAAVVLAGPWTRLSLPDLTIYRRPGQQGYWMVEGVTLRDPDGRDLRVNRYVLDDGASALRAIVDRMARAGRLLRTA